MAPIPANWQVLPFSTEGVLDFLRSLDVYVYYHHPRWVEAFGRGIIEAMATGLPVILPLYFQALFGAAAVYAAPEAAAAEARALHGDPGALARAGRGRRRRGAGALRLRHPCRPGGRADRRRPRRRRRGAGGGRARRCS